MDLRLIGDIYFIREEMGFYRPLVAATECSAFTGFN